MSNLRLLWPDLGVLFKGKGIIVDWREEMERKGWDIETDPSKWEECDLVFYGSDSQLRQVPEPLGKKPTILYFWGWEPGRLLSKEFQQIAAAQIERMALCTRILVPGICTSEQVACFGLPSHVCLPGVNSRALDLSKPSQREDMRVMFLSRLENHKQLGSLIMAISMIRPQPELLVAGPGDRSPYEKLAKDMDVKITFTEIDEEDKATEISKSAVLVHPSTYEGFGLPPLEALYCGTPVAVFDNPQMRWMLQEDAFFFNSVEEMAKVIVQIIQHQGDIDKRTEHGQKRVKEMLTLEHACDRLWPHIHQVIKEHLGRSLRKDQADWAKIYDSEHKRNWAYGNPESPSWASGPMRFDPTWSRHWRAQYVIEALRECKAVDVLDVGCGAVYPTILAKAGFNVSAVDISEEAISQVKEIAEKWGVLDKVETLVGSAEKLPYQDEQFHAVVQGEIWEHVPEPRRIISEGMRVLKEGGYLIASTPCGQHHDDPMHLHHWDDTSITQLLDSWEKNIVSIKQIAEEGADPSCYFIILKKG